MTTLNQAVEMMSYNLIGILDDEVDALESFVNDYDGDTYICDAIIEIADSYIPIYNYDVWKNVSEIQEYIEEAIKYRIADTSSRDVDLISIFQAGYYEYYTQALYNNLDAMCFNYIAGKVNVAINSLNDVIRASIDYDAVYEAIAEATENSDNNDRYYDLDRKAQTIIDSVNTGEFAE